MSVLSEVYTDHDELLQSCGIAPHPPPTHRTVMSVLSEVYTDQDELLQSLVVLPLKLLFNLYHVDLTAQHYDANQGPVRCTRLEHSAN